MLLIRGTFRLAHLEENRNIDGITSPPTTSPNSKQTRSSCTGSGSANGNKTILVVSFLGAVSVVYGTLLVMTTSAPRVIGMLGGMSWESSAEYYRLANELVRERLGGLHSARIVLSSVDFADIEALQVAGRWDEAGQVLAEAAKALEAAGAELLVICTNTMHRVADQVQAAIGIPLLHLGDATAQAVTRAGLVRVGLLGTAFTMEQDFYRDRLTSHGLQVLIPPPDDRSEIHRIIYDELCLGVIREESRQVYRDVIVRLVESGAEGVVLGCTEIELLISDTDSSVPVFPTTRLHVEAAVAASLTTRGSV